MVFAVASTVFSIVGPKILGNATTKLFEGVMAQIAGTGSGSILHYIGKIILIMPWAVSAFVPVQLTSRAGSCPACP